jgi:endonuclease/exonuclease/phosphatase family metal-dependent hydrolase
VALVMILGLIAGVFLRCGACSSCLPGSLRVGTYNIRRFGVEPTDMKRLTAIVEDARVDVLGLQEVQRPEKVGDLAGLLSHDGHRFAYVLTKCSGKSEMHVGFLYDEARVRLASTREYPELDPGGGARCGDERSGLAARFEPVRGGRAFQLLVLHLVHGSERAQQTKRREQWGRAHRIAASLAKEGPVAILGDVNSTGFLDDKGGERSFILDEAKRAGLEVPTSDLKCTEYFQPKGQPFTPSVLDHFVASPGFVRARAVQVHAFCAELACATTASPPLDYTAVSDHCPVTLDVSP